MGKNTKKKKKISEKKAARSRYAASGHKVKLSQCMIVKNEEENIERALSWGKDIMYEQIVVDTGSTDKTVEIAEKLGAKVFRFPWIDDFSAAKNYAIEQASGDWIIFLDADEYFQKQDARPLQKLLTRLYEEETVALIRMNMAHLTKVGEVSSVSQQDRIFRNNSAIRYRNRIHEQLHTLDGSELGFFHTRDEFIIMHTGYAETENKTDKGARNARLLEKELEERPDDAETLMYLGAAYSMAGEPVKALKCYEKIVWNPKAEHIQKDVFERAALQIIRANERLPHEDTVKRVSSVKGRLEELGYTDHPDVDYYEALLLMQENRYEEAAKLFESALYKLERYDGADICAMAGNLELPNSMIARVALESANMQKAVSYAVNVLRTKKYSSDGIDVLLKAFLSEYKPGISVEPYWQFLSKLYDEQNTEDMLFLRRSALEARFPELAEHVSERFPQKFGRL